MSWWTRGASGPAVRDPLTWIVAVLLTAPLLVGVWVAAGRSGSIASDMALINLRLGDVGTEHTPLLGPFSRYGWNHPGPLMFWLLAPLWRLLGADPGAMYAAGAIANLLGLTALVVLARRFGGRRLLAVTAVAALLIVAAAGGVMADPWNPYLAMVPFAVLLLAAASLADGDLVMVPLALGLGSFLVQTHVGYAPLVAIIGGWAVVMGIWRIARPLPDRPRPSARTAWILAVASLAVVALAWSGPIVEQVTEDPGNVRLIIDYFTSADEEVEGPGAAAGALGRQLHPLGPWLGGVERPVDSTLIDPASLAWAAPALLLLAGSLWWSARRGDRRPLVLGGTAAVAVAAATLASARITGETYFYLLRFWWPVAMLVWVAIGWVVARAVPTTGERAARLAAPLLVTVLLVGGVANGIEQSQGVDRLPGAEAVTAVTARADEFLVPGGTYLVETTGWSYFGELFGVMDQLDRDGYTVVTEPRFVTQFGSRRVQGGEGAPDRFDGRLIVAASGAADRLASDPALTLIGSWHPLNDAERAEAESLWAEVRRTLIAAGQPDLAAQVGDAPLEWALTLAEVRPEDVGISEATLDRLNELEARDVRLALLLAPTGETVP